MCLESFACVPSAWCVFLGDRCFVPLSHRSSYSDAYHLYGIAMLDLGRRDEALAFTRRAVEMTPTDANFHNSLGEVLRRNGTADDVAEAAVVFRKSLQLDPTSASVANNLGA